jgi:LuxR family transcriptional regulator, maltose regulon positive regulatory protein
VTASATATTSGLVLRTSLFEVLSAARAGGVTLVSAPAGSGKTALLRCWAAAAETSTPIAWVSVERGERDAQRFWLSLIDELGRVTGHGGCVQRLSPAPDFDGETAVGRLLSDLASLKTPVVLVIDDLHELGSNEALAQLEFLLGRLPAKLRVVLATRHDPRLGLHRLRLAGELTEIRAADLRFTASEARDLLAGAGIELSDAALAMLHERTEGWAAGLRLAAMSIAGHSDPERFVTEFSGSERTVADYLLAEVLDRQTDEVRQLLLRTSLLERVSGSLADFLTGGTGSERILQGLEEANAFVVSLDVGRSWFRYHHLFADLLRLELRRTAPDKVAELHRAASEWLAEHGYVLEAIEHLQAAGDWSQAARLLADNMISLGLDGRGATVRALLAAFPENARSSDPELSWAFAGAELERGSLDSAVAYLADAEKQAAAVPEERRRRFDLQLGIARLTLARRRGDLATVRSELRRLEAAWEAQTASELPLSNDLHALALADLGMAELWFSRLDDARRHLLEGVALAARIGRPWLEVGCRSHLAMAAFDRSFTLARKESEETIAFAETHGLGADPVAAMAHVVLGGALAWTGHFDEAERSLDRAEALRAEAEPATGLILHYCKGAVRAGQGRLPEALAAFRAAEELEALFTDQPFLLVPLRGELLHMQVRLGETDAVREALAALSEGKRKRGELQAVVAAVSLAEGDPQQAIELLAPVIDGSMRVLNPVSIIHALLLSATAHAELGDSRSAQDAVERALELAEPDGAILPFTVVPVHELLERHPRHSTAHAALLTDILDVLAGSALADAPVPAREALSDGELRVLRYLPSNLSAPEIGAELYLSPNTVKTHMRHIYAKLGAHSRSEAVVRARELALLAPPARRR